MSMSWNDEYLTVAEIAAKLKLNQQTVRNWIDQGRLPAVRVGRRVRVRQADIDYLLTQGAQGARNAPLALQSDTAETPADIRKRVRQTLQGPLKHAQQLLAGGTEDLEDLTDAVARLLQLVREEPKPANSQDAVDTTSNGEPGSPSDARD
jgi:excisionase family DNA binding protein